MSSEVRPRIFLGPGILAATALLAAVRDNWTAAAVASILALLLTHGLVSSSRLRHDLQRAQAMAGSAAAAVVRTVLLTPILLLVVTPAGWLGRLVHGPRSGHRTTSSSWRAPSTTGSGPPGRRWADERSWRPMFEPATRRATVVGTVLAVLLVQAVIIGALALIQRRSSPRPQLAGITSVGNGQSAALRGLPWASEAQGETGEVSNQIVATPFTGLSIRNYHGRYVNVQDRVRRSYQTKLTGAAPINIWFFGGSTMFGFDLQRDDHTIPSEVVRLAEADGIPVRARNYGSTGYVNYQETQLLTLLLGGGEKPDLVVFYDGVNDESLAFLNASGGFDPPGEPSYLGSFEARQALARRPLSDGGPVPQRTDLPPSPLLPTSSRNPLSASSLINDTVDVYGQGVDLSRTLGHRYAVPVTHFWQPEIYSRRPLDPGERALFPNLGLDQFRYDTIAKLLARTRQALPAGVVDLSSSLDTVKGPVFSDSAHINETGARAVAKAMYSNLKGQLTALQAGR